MRTPFGALVLTPHASGMLVVPLAPLSCAFGDFRRLWASGCCWTERMSHRHTFLVISLTAHGCACHPPIYAHSGTDIRPTYARLAFGRHRCRRLSMTDIRRNPSTPAPRDTSSPVERPSDAPRYRNPRPDLIPRELYERGFATGNTGYSRHRSGPGQGAQP